MKHLCVGIALLCVSFALSCSTSDNLAGTGSSSSNDEKVLCRVQLPDGSLASNAALLVRSASFIADTSGLKGDQGIVRQTVTDEYGMASIDSLDTGTFALQVVHGDSLSCFARFSLTHSDSIIDLDTLRLAPNATLSGIVVVDTISLPDASVFVFVEGTELAARVESTGSFALFGVPQTNQLPIRIAAYAKGITINVRQSVTVAEKISRIIDPILIIDDFVRDTLAVRALLNVNGLDSVRVADVCSLSANRVIALQLDHRGISTIPPEFANLTALRIIDLSANRIDSLPSAFYACTSLASLSLDSNPITVLSKDIRKLKRLSEFRLRFGLLNGLPAELFLYTSLTSISVHGNAISSLPDAVGSCISLRNLSVGNNRMTSLPSTIGKLRYLENLHVAGNQLDSLPSSIGAISVLGTLTVDNNRLSALPDSIVNLRYLRNLNIAGNRICAPSAAVKSFLDAKWPGWDSTQVCQ